VSCVVIACLPGMKCVIIITMYNLQTYECLVYRSQKSFFVTVTINGLSFQTMANAAVLQNEHY